MWQITTGVLCGILTLGLLAVVLGIGKGSDLWYGLAKVAGMVYLWVIAMVVSYVFVAFMRWLVGKMG